jgi:DNA-binding CsgD family transcriptional regulator
VAIAVGFFGFARIASVRRRFGLTPREDEILFWIARGKSNAEIGEILGISAATVGKHLDS